MVLFKVVKQDTVKPIDGQKLGTSGLRKKVTVFKQDHYRGNSVRIAFDALPFEKVKGAALIPLEFEHMDILQNPLSNNQ